MPHHTFLWEGIDGTRVFTHFPPADTYVGEVSGADLARAERKFHDIVTHPCRCSRSDTATAAAVRPAR